MKSILFLVSFILINCSTQESVNEDFTFSRSVCFGKCPAYILRLENKAFVFEVIEIKERKQIPLTQEQQDKIRLLVLNINTQEMDSVYGNPKIYDLPKYQIQEGTKTIRVVDSRQAPNSIKTLINYLNNFL